MDFSEPFKLTSRASSALSRPVSDDHPLVKFSPDGKFVANAVQFRLIVRDALDTLQISQLFTCLDAIVSFSWSPDSKLIMCLMPRRALIQIWSLEQSDWSCKIDEGSAGLKWALWTPDSLHVISNADFDVRATVWSLTSKAVAYVKHMSKAGINGLAFSADDRYMAFAERRDCKDALSVFDLTSWSLVKHFSLPTRELAGLAWKPSAREHVVAVWESFFFGFDVTLFALTGDILGRFSNDDFLDSIVQKNRITSLGAGTAMYLPWVLCLFNMIIRGNGMTELMGIFVGHLYFFLMFKYPQDFGGRSFLSTPQFLYKWLPNRRGGVSGFGQAPASRRGPGPNGGGGGGGGYNWGGTGHVLGGN